jgi:hypothetical protein
MHHRVGKAALALSLAIGGLYYFAARAQTSRRSPAISPECLNVFRDGAPRAWLMTHSASSPACSLLS